MLVSCNSHLSHPGLILCRYICWIIYSHAFYMCIYICIWDSQLIVAMVHWIIYTCSIMHVELSVLVIGCGYRSISFSRFSLSGMHTSSWILGKCWFEIKFKFLSCISDIKLLLIHFINDSLCISLHMLLRCNDICTGLDSLWKHAFILILNLAYSIQCFYVFVFVIVYIYELHIKVVSFWQKFSTTSSGSVNVIYWVYIDYYIHVKLDAHLMCPYWAW